MEKNTSRCLTKIIVRKYMRKNRITYLYLLLFCFILSVNSNAATFKAVSDGNWVDSSTWDKPGVPGESDEVFINGYSVTIDASTGDVTVKNIYLLNASNTEASRLIINGMVTLTVTNDLEATAKNFDEAIELILYNGATLIIEDDLEFTRESGNNSNKGLSLRIEDNSQVIVHEDFIFEYLNANTVNVENVEEIFIDDTALLDVTGNTLLEFNGGNNFDFHLQGSAQVILRGGLEVNVSGGKQMTITSSGDAHFQVMGNTTVNNSGSNVYTRILADGTAGQFTFEGDLTLSSTSANKIIYMEATGDDSVIDIRGDISMSATTEGDVYVDLKAGDMFLGGEILRPTDFGSFYMEDDATLTFNGDNPQSITYADLAGSGSDALNFTNVAMDNPSGITLQDTLFIEHNFTLTSGKITSTAAEILIIGDQATITGGSETAYIIGPVIKQGRTADSTFLFPIGNATTYAPIKISGITSSTSEYTAEYFGDPPPFGNSLAEEVTGISETQYWSLTRTEESDDVEVTLFWTDAAESGIESLESLIVVGLSEEDVWESYGNGGTTGGTGSGVPGSVSSMMGDPPPFGVSRFTIGSGPEEKVLPVELIDFDATQDGESINLKWRTGSEINTKHFIIERSHDGIEFKGIATVLSKGDSNRAQSYSGTDTAPLSGVNYYRLKIVDWDGTYEYSPIEVVNFQPRQGLNVYPNPVDDMLSIVAMDSSKDNEGVLEVFSSNGQMIYCSNIDLTNGSYQISTSTLNVRIPGVYLVRFTNASGSQIIRFNKR